MRRTLTTLTLAGAVGVTGLAGTALLAPAVSYAATGTTTGPVAWVQDALAELVTDGAITQAPADEVATTVEASRPEGGPRGGHGRHGGSTSSAAPGVVVPVVRAARPRPRPGRRRRHQPVPAPTSNSPTATTDGVG